MWLVLILVTTSTSLGAQWFTHPSPGILRTADGKPDLAAAVLRTPDGKPDLSGMWQMHPGSCVVNVTQDLNPDEIQPWAEKRYENTSCGRLGSGLVRSGVQPQLCPCCFG